jgi:general secretion pathway protein A
MYEHYYGLSEKPFSLTPDPKYLYRSQSHGNAFDLLQYAIDRREGFVVVTGDIGTGKTTLCRALLEQIDRTTFTALVLNPFLTEEDLLKRILQDFGVIAREDLKTGRLVNATKQELIETLYEFLLSLIPLNAGAVLIIDEAQNLPLPVLEQIRILSNLETDTEKLLQIILVGQLNLLTLLRSPEMRQLDQRVSIRYQLEPLDVESVAAYVSHRLEIAGGNGAAVTFASMALKEVHRWSGGIPRLINLICDRALLAAFSIRSSRITTEMVAHAAENLDVPTPPLPALGWLGRKAPFVAAAAVVLLSSTFAVGASAYVYQRFAASASVARSTARVGPIPAVSITPARAVPQNLPATAAAADRGAPPDRELPAEAAFTILVSSFPDGLASTASNVASTTEWLEASGFRVFHAQVHLGSRGRWQRVLAGAYSDSQSARRDMERIRAAAPQSDAHLVSAGFAIGLAAAAPRNSDSRFHPSSMEP